MKKKIEHLDIRYDEFPNIDDLVQSLAEVENKINELVDQVNALSTVEDKPE